MVSKPVFPGKVVWGIQRGYCRLLDSWRRDQDILCWEGGATFEGYFSVFFGRGGKGGNGVVEMLSLPAICFVKKCVSGGLEAVGHAREYWEL